MQNTSQTTKGESAQLEQRPSKPHVGDHEAPATMIPDHAVSTADSRQQASSQMKPDSSGYTPSAGSSLAPESSKSHADDKWNDALVRTKLNAAAQAASSGEDNSPKARWHRAFVFAKQISGPKLEQETNQDPVGVEEPESNPDTSKPNDAILARAASFDVKGMVQKAKERAYNRDPETGKRRPFKSAGGQKAIKVKKKLEEQHWLEMIDPKHRYGSNLKYYFEEWKLSDAHGNFFYWLDNGPGKNLSLAKCPREKLEKENILYLSADQRRHYLVFIDPKDGKFRWPYPSKEAVEYTGEEHPLVDTTGKLWTDLGEGRGVAPVAALPKPEAEEAQEADLSETESDEEEDVVDSAGYSSDASLSSIEIPAEVRPGALRRTSSTSIPGSPSPEPSPPIQGQNEQERGVSTLSTATPKETKKSEKKSKKKQKGDVWIYASDSTYNIYLGIKQKGYFQHSSFLAGGPITSAGTLIIKNGILLGCNPMSGHYRTKAVYFKRFIEELERDGADLSQVKVGQTELKLWFVERANTLHSLKGKTRRLAKGFEKKLHIDDRHHQPLEGVVEEKKEK